MQVAPLNEQSTYLIVSSTGLLRTVSKTRSLALSGSVAPTPPSGCSIPLTRTSASVAAPGQWASRTSATPAGSHALYKYAVILNYSRSLCTWSCTHGLQSWKCSTTCVQQIILDVTCIYALRGNFSGQFLSPNFGYRFICSRCSTFQYSAGWCSTLNHHQVLQTTTMLP